MVGRRKVIASRHRRPISLPPRSRRLAPTLLTDDRVNQTKAIGQ